MLKLLLLTFLSVNAMENSLRQPLNDQIEPDLELDGQAQRNHSKKAEAEPILEDDLQA